MLFFKKIIFSFIDLFHFRVKKKYESNLKGISSPKCENFNSTFRVGIIKETNGLHADYIKACEELKISYYVFDIFKDNWFKIIDSERVDFIVVRPSVNYDPWKQMYDNRIKILSDNTTTPIFPDNLSLWLWESKLRATDWFKINNVKSVKSHIFYNQIDAKNFLSSCEYPQVYKSSSGSGSSGVKIIKNKISGIYLINKVFNKGYRTYRKHHLDKEHGFIIFQKYVPDLREWRIIRIGEKYFGFEKLIQKEFHSGSQNFSYGMPPLKCLDFVRKLTTKFNFLFTSVDLFIDTSGKVYVNEIQPYFAQKDDRELLRIDGKSGYLKYLKQNNEYEFIPGSFCRNNLCNERLIEIMKLLDDSSDC